MSRAIDDLFSQFFGAGPIPPESVARRVLGIGGAVELNESGIKAAFRCQVRLVHPDLSDERADRLAIQTGTDDAATRVTELTWARDDLLHRLPRVTASAVTACAHDEPSRGVTGSFGRSGNDGETSRNANACKNCHGTRLTPPCSIPGFEGAGGNPYRQHKRGRWAGWCWACAGDAQRNEQRRPRQTRPCATCGKPFTGTRSDVIHCSAACRQRAYRKRVLDGGKGRA